MWDARRRFGHAPEFRQSQSEQRDGNAEQHLGDPTFWEWVAELEPDTRQRKADKGIAMAAADNEYGGETLFWARAMFPIISLSTSGHLAPPRPAAFNCLEEEAHEDTPLGMLRKFLQLSRAPPERLAFPKRSWTPSANSLASSTPLCLHRVEWARRIDTTTNHKA